MGNHLRSQYRSCGCTRNRGPSNHRGIPCFPRPDCNLPGSARIMTPACPSSRTSVPPMIRSVWEKVGLNRVCRTKLKLEKIK